MILSNFRIPVYYPYLLQLGIIGHYVLYPLYISLPQIAAEVASPMNKIEDIVMVSGNDGSMSSEVTKLLAQLPPSVQALTGLDITKVCNARWIRFNFK